MFLADNSFLVTANSGVFSKDFGVIIAKCLPIKIDFSKKNSNVLVVFLLTFLIKYFAASFAFNFVNNESNNRVGQVDYSFTGSG